MSDDPLPYLIAYPASFCESPEEARRNIWRMIEAGIPGWDVGHAAWVRMLERQLGLPNRTRKLNRHGARFSAGEWVWLMRSLLDDCEAAMRRGDGPSATEPAADAIQGADGGPPEQGGGTLAPTREVHPAAD